MIRKLGLIAVAIGVVLAGALAWHLANRPKPALPVEIVEPASGEMSAAEIEADRLKNLAFERDQETAPLARWSGVARREGDVLTIRLAGRDVASFTDSGYCDGFDQCARWRFRGVWHLGGRDYPWLTFFHGEGEEMAFFTDTSGALFGAAGEPSASPDGRWMVLAYNDPDMGGSVSVFEAAPGGLNLVADSDLAGCDAVEWEDDAHLAMICIDSDTSTGQRYMTAVLGKDERGWRITPRAELDPATKQPLAMPSRPLVGFELKAVDDTQAPPDLGQDEGDGNYLVEKGYKRL